MRRIIPILALAPLLAAWQPPLSHYLRGIDEGYDRSDSPSNYAQYDKYRGEKGDSSDDPPVISRCFATGSFNLSSRHDLVRLETWCQEDKEDGALFQVQDTIVHRDKKRKAIFDIPFDNAVLSIRESKKGVAMFLHFEFEGKFYFVPLPKRDGGTYAYSFEDHVPDEVTPTAEMRYFVRRK